MNSPDDRIEQRARALFRQASHSLDPAMAGRLRAARRDALQTATPAHRAVRLLLLPAGAFAAVALAALMVWSPRHPVPAGAPATMVAAAAARAPDDGDLPPDADSADPALYQNLDFYGWLAANDPPATTRR